MDYCVPCYRARMEGANTFVTNFEVRDARNGKVQICTCKSCGHKWLRGKKKERNDERTDNCC